MESRAKILGHPVHPMLINFPLGLLPTAVAFDIVHLSTQNPRWNDLAFWMIVAGVIGALFAAVFGLVDWLAIPARTRAKRIGAVHGLGNLVVVALFAASLYLRYQTAETPSTAALVCSFVGLGLALITAWLGGELVDRLGIGVDDGANVNAPSSLGRASMRPAHETFRTGGM
ncbi:MAG TPA: DUF2231 domain-containing protein [Candidatus Binatia bacterium]|jgi:uncharacterized membrane protein